MTRYLTPDEAAHVLRVHPGTIRRLLREGRLVGVRVGRQWRIAEDSLTPQPVAVGDPMPRRRTPKGRMAQVVREIEAA